MPFLTQGKTNWKFLLIVIVLAAVVGGGILWCPKIQEVTYQPTETQEPTEVDETADWQTYRNEEYGFEFKYPEEFDTYKGCELEEEKNGYTFGSDVIFGARVGARIELSILDSQGLNLSEYVYKEFPKDLEEIEAETTNGQVLRRTFVETREDINIGDEEAVKVIHYSGGMGRYGEDAFLLKNDKIYRFSAFSGITCGGLEEEMKKKDTSIFDYFNQMLSTFRFVEEDENAPKTIRNVDFVEYLTNVYYTGMGDPSEFCMSSREPIYINYIKYYDLDNDDEEEAIIQAYTCFTGTAGPDINAIYKLLPNGEIIELETNDNFQGKSIFDEHNWKNYGFDIKDGKLVDTVPIYNDNDSNCCPTGGTKEIFYDWDGEEFVVTGVIIKK